MSGKGLLMSLGLLAAVYTNAQIQYPATKKVDQTDTYFEQK